MEVLEWTPSGRCERYGGAMLYRTYGPDSLVAVSKSFGRAAFKDGPRIVSRFNAKDKVAADRLRAGKKVSAMSGRKYASAREAWQRGTDMGSRGKLGPGESVGRYYRQGNVVRVGMGKSWRSALARRGAAGAVPGRAGSKFTASARSSRADAETASLFGGSAKPPVSRAVRAESDSLFTGPMKTQYKGTSKPWMDAKSARLSRRKARTKKIAHERTLQGPRGGVPDRYTPPAPYRGTSGPTLANSWEG